MVAKIISGKSIIGALNYDEGPLCSIFNLGGSQTVTLNQMIAAIETALGKKAIINEMPEQPGDVPLTSADVSKAAKHLNFKPTTHLDTGIPKFVEWFLEMRKLGLR